MSLYNVLIHTEDERTEIKNLLLDYTTQPEIAFKIQGNLIYQVETDTKQVYISPAFIVLKNLGVVVIDLSQFRNIIAHTSNIAYEIPIIMVQDVCDKDDP